MAQLFELIHFERNPIDTIHLIFDEQKNVKGSVLKPRYLGNVILSFVE